MTLGCAERDHHEPSWVMYHTPLCRLSLSHVLFSHARSTHTEACTIHARARSRKRRHVQVTMHARRVCLEKHDAPPGVPLPSVALWPKAACKSQKTNNCQVLSGPGPTNKKTHSQRGITVQYSAREATHLVFPPPRSRKYEIHVAVGWGRDSRHQSLEARSSRPID